MNRFSLISKNKLYILLIGFLSAFIIYPIYLYFKEPYFSVALSFILVLYIDNPWFLFGWLLNGLFLYFIEIYEGNFAAILITVPIIEIFLKEYKKEENTNLKKAIILILLFVMIFLIFYLFVYQNITIRNILFK
ncbi:MAG: hypothetical protein QW714_02170 [Nanopusillaceae archaeon]